MGSANSKGKKKSQPKNATNNRKPSEGSNKATTKDPNTSNHEETNVNPTTSKNHKPNISDDANNLKGRQKHDEDDDNSKEDDDPLKNLKRLQAACQKENLTAVKTLTKKHKVSVTEPDPSSGKVALHYCVSNKETETAEVVLATDASCLNLKDDAGFTALLLASVAGNLKMVKFLKERGSSVRTADNEGHSACHWAAVCGHEEVLEYLQENGADLSAMDKNGATPLHYAVHGNDDVTQAKSLKMTRMLLDKGVKVDAVDEDGRTPLLWAASSGREKICKVLLDSGANVESFDQDKLTGLHSAAAKGHADCIEVLLDRGAKIEATDKNGCTPLFYAIHQSEMDCAKLLLQKKANHNHCDVKGRSVSHCAAATGNLEAMKLLKQHKADLWIKSKETGDLPIHEAAMAGHTEVVQFLMEGLDPKTNTKDAINRSNAKGKTCLHMAALSNNLPLCKYLVQNGADVNAAMKHESGELLPYDCAVLKNNNECAKYLKQNGARSSKDESKAAAPKPVTKQDSKSSDKKSENDKKAPETRRNPVSTKEMSCQTDKDGGKKELVNSESQTIQPTKKASDKAVQSPMKPSPSVDRENGRLTDRGTQTTETKSTPQNGKKEVLGKAKPNKTNQENDSPKKDTSPNKAKKEKSPAKENNNKDADSDRYSSDEGGEDSGTYSEDDKQNNKKGKAENNDRKKQQPKPEQKPNRNQSKPQERSHIETRRLVNLNVHPTIIREQVRAYETKRLAAMKLNHSNRMKMNGKGFSEQRLVRKLARDYNEDARTEDRIPSGHFKTLKDFDNFLRGEINIADVDEKRLRKLEKIKPIYYITF